MNFSQVSSADLTRTEILIGMLNASRQELELAFGPGEAELDATEGMLFQWSFSGSSAYYIAGAAPSYSERVVWNIAGDPGDIPALLEHLGANFNDIWDRFKLSEVE